jgi:hypothetical protein
MEKPTSTDHPLPFKVSLGSGMIALLIFAVGCYFLLLPIYKAMRHGWLIIDTDSGCYIDGQQGSVREGGISYYIPGGVYTIKSDKHPNKSWTLITTGHSFNADMPSGTCASVLDPRLERTFSCTGCAEAYWVTDSPE